MAWASKHKLANTAKLGITGFCRGGRTVWMYSAYNPKVKAGVAWYGGLNANPPAQAKTPADIAGQLHAPVLGLYGGKDQGIPQTAIDKLNAALKAAGKDKQSQIHVYPDMPHAFHADYRPIEDAPGNWVVGVPDGSPNPPISSSSPSGPTTPSMPAPPACSAGISAASSTR